MDSATRTRRWQRIEVEDSTSRDDSKRQDFFLPCPISIGPRGA